jgi:hypothetical protein
MRPINDRAPRVSRQVDLGEVEEGPLGAVAFRVFPAAAEVVQEVADPEVVAVGAVALSRSARQELPKRSGIVFSFPLISRTCSIRSTSRTPWASCLRPPLVRVCRSVLVLVDLVAAAVLGEAAEPAIGECQRRYVSISRQSQNLTPGVKEASVTGS